MRGLRGLDLAKPPGVAETIDWAQALAALGREELDAEIVEQTLGSVLKYHEDLETVRDAALRDARRGGARCRLSALVRQVVTFGRVLREAGLEVGPGPHLRRDDGARRGRPRPPRRRLLDAPADARLARRRPRRLRPRLRRVVPARAGARAVATPRVERARAAKVRPRDGADETAGGRRTEDERRRLERRGAAPREGLLGADRRGADAAPRADRRARRRPAAAALTAAAPRPARRRRSTCAGSSARRSPPAATRSSARSGAGVETHRKLIVLCDVSGSMEPYSRAILLFVHALLEAAAGSRRSRSARG